MYYPEVNLQIKNETEKAGKENQKIQYNLIDIKAMNGQPGFHPIRGKNPTKHT